MTITAMIHDSASRGPNSTAVKLDFPAIFEVLPRIGDDIQGENKAGDYFEGKVGAVSHKLNEQSGTFEPRLYVDLTE